VFTAKLKQNVISYTINVVISVVIYDVSMIYPFRYKSLMKILEVNIEQEDKVEALVRFFKIMTFSTKLFCEV